MLNEFQTYPRDFCRFCGAILYDSEDWLKPKWEEGECWAGPNHEAANHKDEIEDSEMVEKIYYHRDSYHRPIVTVCLLKENGNIARGVSVCSPKDNPDKKRGRHIARGRAIMAMENEFNNVGFDILRVDALLSMRRAQCNPGDFYWSKAAFNPKLTDFEEKLLGDN